MKIPPVLNSEKLMELNFTILHSFHGWVHRPTVIKSVFEYTLTNKHYVCSGLVVHSYPKETIFVVGVFCEAAWPNVPVRCAVVVYWWDPWVRGRWLRVRQLAKASPLWQMEDCKGRTSWNGLRVGQDCWQMYNGELSNWWWDAAKVDKVNKGI